MQPKTMLLLIFYVGTVLVALAAFPTPFDGRVLIYGLASWCGGVAWTLLVRPYLLSLRPAVVVLPVPTGQPPEPAGST